MGGYTVRLLDPEGNERERVVCDSLPEARRVAARFVREREADEIVEDYQRDPEEERARRAWATE